jgi:glycine/D-amino acid oxidase-like deaminating enzyme
VYVPSDGYAESGRVVAKLAGLAFDQGVHIHPQTTAASLLYEMDRVVGVCTEDGDTIFADHTVVAMGAWTKLLVPDIAPFIRTTGHPVFHLKPADPRPFESARFPVWSDDASASGWYGFPLHPREGIVKIAHHGEGRLKHPVLDERTVIEAEDAMLRDFLRIAIPALAEAPIVYRRLCLYCDTLDQHFWIDRSPHNPGLTVATGGSGHGFKFGPVLGSLIADAVEDKTNPYRHKFAWRDLPPDTQGTEGRRYHADS